MLRDPTWAYVYWDMSVARVSDAVGVLGGGRAFLRLFGVPTAQLVAEHEVSAERGEYGVALPESGRSYVAELALVHNDREAVLARSDVIQPPSSVSRPTLAPAFVSRAEQLGALANGLTLARTGAVPHPAATLAPTGMVSFGSMGSEARLSRFGSEQHVAVSGSAGGLAQGQGLPTASSVRPDATSDASAVSAVAAAVGSPTDPNDVLAARHADPTALADRASSDASTRSGQSIAAIMSASAGSQGNENVNDSARGSTDRSSRRQRFGRFWRRQLSRWTLHQKLRRRS